MKKITIICSMDGAYRFWKNVDHARGELSLVQLADECQLNYKVIKNQRSSDKLPSLLNAYAIAKYLNVSIEYLLTGKETSSGKLLSDRVMIIAKACEKASDLELVMVEKILDIPPAGKNIDIQKAL